MEQTELSALLVGEYVGTDTLENCSPVSTNIVHMYALLFSNSNSAYYTYPQKCYICALKCIVQDSLLQLSS